MYIGAIPYTSVTIASLTTIQWYNYYLMQIKVSSIHV